MSLIDDLRQAAPAIPPSHVPTQHELAGVLGALILHLEHDEAFLRAAAEGMAAVGDVIQPPQEEVPDTETADQAAVIVDLRTQLAAAKGALNHPTVTVETVDEAEAEAV